MSKKKERKINFNIIKDNKVLTKSFVINSCILIFLLSFVFFNFGELTQVTISAVGNSNNHLRLLFIAWGFSVAFCSTVLLIRLFNMLNYKVLFPRIVLLIANISLSACTLIPSSQDLPQVSKYHDFCAILFAVCLLFAIVIFLFRLTIINKYAGKICWQLFIYSMLIPIFMFFLYGHCGMYEVAFFLTISIFLFGISAYLGKFKNEIDMSKDSKKLNKNDLSNLSEPKSK